MGWSIGFDRNWNRDIGYGVPAYCDHPKCNKEIDRGLAYVCGGEPHGGDDGCGLYFCYSHLFYGRRRNGSYAQMCLRCVTSKSPYKRPKPEHPAWIAHKLTDESWAEWRQENPAEVESLKQLAGAA